MMQCTVCNANFEQNSELATQVYRRNGSVVAVTDIPTTVICSRCGNAVLERETAQEVETLLFNSLATAK